MLGLDYLLDPITREEFLNNYFGSSTLRIPCTNNKFDELFGWQEANQLIAHGSNSNRTDQLIFNDELLETKEFGNLGKWLMDGASYFFTKLQETDPIIDQLARVIGAEFNCRANVDARIWPSTGKFGKLMVDQRHLFVISQQGAQELAIHKPTLANPLSALRKDMTIPELSEPYYECTLSPGDVIYIPRGHWYSVLTREHAITVTIGMDPVTPYDFLTWLCQRLLHTSDWARESLPVSDSAWFLGNQSGEKLEQYLEDFSTRAMNELSGVVLKQHFREFIMEQNRMPGVDDINLPDQFNLADHIGLDTEFQITPGQKILLQHDTAANTCGVLARGKIVRFPELEVALMEALFSTPGENITARRTWKKAPDADPSKIISMLYQLQVEGVLKIVEVGNSKGEGE